ncbi:GTPase-activating protein GYP5 [Spathaspora sp. JA1]|nr:GTPase-activating protein GYP5 [Spathaspora sp. JA1]
MSGDEFEDAKENIESGQDDGQDNGQEQDTEHVEQPQEQNGDGGDEKQDEQDSQPNGDATVAGSADGVPPLPNRKSIEVCIRLDDPGSGQSQFQAQQESVDMLTTISTTYDKASSNYLLQSKFNQLNLKFREQNNQIQEAVNTGTENIKKTFNDIKNTVGGFSNEMFEYKIDWDFWTQIVNDYDYVINHESDKLNQVIMSGIPKEFRGIIWQLVSKSKNFQLEEFYLHLKVESSIHEKAIKRDLSRTSFFTNVEQVNKAQELFNVIKSYSLFDPDVGYTQGMIFIAIPLIMNMSEAECFSMLVTLMKEYRLRDLFCPEMKGLHLMLYEFDRLLETYSPVLYNHLVKQGIKSSMYASQWFLTFFAYKFPLDIVLRIFDIIITQGMESILKFAVNLMLKNETNLLSLSFDNLLEFLKDKLFNIYVNEEFINYKEGGESDKRSSTRFSLLSGSKSSTSNGATSNKRGQSYYKLDSLVTDSMKINLDPVELTKYENEFENIYNNEQSKIDDIKQIKLENGNLRHKIKELEIKYSKLNMDHIEIVQNMVDLKITLPDLINDNEDLTDNIEQLKRDIQELESKMVESPSISTTDINSKSSLPVEIENNIQELLKVNAEETERAVNLEEELSNLLEEQNDLEQELKKYNKTGTWFRWGKKV